MDITPYVESLRRDLLAAADAAGPEAHELAERLAFALDPAARLALMEAISQAAAEITAELPTAGVEVRLNGRDLDFSVQTVLDPSLASGDGGDPPDPAGPEDEGNLARITLRIPESVKAKAEELASRSGHSLNTWLVNLVRAATREGGVNIGIDLSGIPFLGTDPNFGNPPGGQSRGKRPGKRMSGWV